MFPLHFVRIKKEIKYKQNPTLYNDQLSAKFPYQCIVWD